MSNKSKVKKKSEGQWNITVSNAIKCSQNLCTHKQIKLSWNSAIILICFSDKMHPVHYIKFEFVPDFGEVVAEVHKWKVMLNVKFSISVSKTDLIFDKKWLLVSVVLLLSVSFPLKSI